MMKKTLLPFLLVFCMLTFYVHTTNAKTGWLGELKGGIRIQKTQKLYWENGVEMDFTSQKLANNRIHVGVSYVTSRLGSALGSNGIKQDNFLFSPGYFFRHQKQLEPFVRLNLGWFHANYEAAVFDVLPNKALLAALDAGISYRFKWPMTLVLGAGYNFNSGTGTAGPGTLFPVFYSMTCYYTILSNR